MSQAYGVLDKYKISKTFFVKTDQADCAYLDSRIPDEPITKKPVRQNSQTAASNVKSAIALNDDEAREEAEVGILAEKPSLDSSKIIAEESTKVEQSVETVPERILKVAETIKEEADVNAKTIIVEVKEELAAENAKESEHPNETEKKTA